MNEFRTWLDTCTITLDFENTTTTSVGLEHFFVQPDILQKYQESDFYFADGGNKLRLKRGEFANSSFYKSTN